MWHYFTENIPKNVENIENRQVLPNQIKQVRSQAVLQQLLVVGCVTATSCGGPSSCKLTSVVSRMAFPSTHVWLTSKFSKQCDKK
jgi:hypothetical protein